MFNHVMKLVLCVAVLVPTSAYAQKSICHLLGKVHVATYRDVVAIQYDRDTKIKPHNVDPNRKRSGCGPHAVRVGYTCVEYATVGHCNTGGLGACDQPDSKFTQECFNVQVCLESTKAHDGMCSIEAAKADATRPFALSCNSQSGTWEDSYGETFNLKQEPGSPFVTGTAQVYGVNYADCGEWTVSGTRIESNLSLKLTNPFPPIPGKCCSEHNIHASAACGYNFGRWDNACGFGGNIDMVRTTNVSPLYIETERPPQNPDVGPTDQPPGTDRACTNINGTWVDNYGSTYTITHDLDSRTFTGTVHTIGHPNAPDSRRETCGDWNLTGSVQDSGSVVYRVENPQWSEQEVFCCLFYGGVLTSDCNVFEGGWGQNCNGIDVTQRGPLVLTPTGGQQQ